MTDSHERIRPLDADKFYPTGGLTEDLPVPDISKAPDEGPPVITIKCPKCGKNSDADEKMVGERVACQICAHEFICDRTLQDIEKLPEPDGYLTPIFGLILSFGGGFLGLVLGSLFGFFLFHFTRDEYSVACCALGGALLGFFPGVYWRWRNL